MQSTAYKQQVRVFNLLVIPIKQGIKLIGPQGPDEWCRVSQQAW